MHNMKFPEQLLLMAGLVCCAFGQTVIQSNISGTVTDGHGIRAPEQL